VLQIGRNFAAIRNDLRNDLFVKPNVHDGGVVGIAGIVKLLASSLRAFRLESISSAFIKSTIDVRHSSFFFLSATALSKIGATSTLAAGAAAADDPGVELTLGADAPAVGLAPDAASALVPKIAPMIFPTYSF
jgi:hypothetical protein